MICQDGKFFYSGMDYSHHDPLSGDMDIRDGALVARQGGTDIAPETADRDPALDPDAEVFCLKNDSIVFPP